MPSTSRNEQDRDASLSARETPLPWGKLTVLLAVRLAEPIGMTLILPFMYQMVGGFDVVKDPKDISFYAGMLLTSFSIFKALTVMHWGILSDRIGRRPVILLGLLGNLLTFVLFGVSKSFKWALVARSLNGMFTGNSVVIKTVVAEISDSTNRPRMMALLPLMWNLGMMLGGAVGGALVDPVAKYPWLFGGSVLFREYPYLLPCLVGSTASFFGLVVGFFQLEETLVIRPSTGSTASVGRPATETTALVLDAQNEEGRDQPAVTERTPSKWAILTPTVIRVLATNTIMCLAIAMHNQIYPIYAATDIADGGLGMDAQSIGYTLTFCGILVVYFQLVMYPILADKYGALACYRRGLLLLALFSTTFPLLSILVKYTVILFWLLLLAQLYVRTLGDILSFASISLLVSNVAPRKTDLGFMNGLQQQTTSITYIIGPLISGYLWSWSIKHSFPYPFNSHFVWVLGGASLVVAWYMSLSIPDSVNIFASEEHEPTQEVASDNASANTLTERTRL
ncbi:hypothetical protein EV177_002607 [Coemansia sp. RSA 1804]|nr:hypothetical protein EV177_002607 [Coemansia sp. RSA 1804]